MKRLGVIVCIVGCGFQSTPNGTPNGTPIDSNNPPPVDASITDTSFPGTDVPPIDARVCFGTGLVKVCLLKAPSGPVSYAGSSNTLDTSMSSNCHQVIAQGSGQPELCVIAGTMVSVAGTLTATGSRPLVLIAADTLTVPGTLDVSSAINSNPRRGAGANQGSCMNPSAAASDAGGAGGGGGGSLATKGGDGGTGDLNDNGFPSGTARGGSAGQAQNNPSLLRGGCRGGDGGSSDGQHRGAGGDGGGAVYLIAGTSITIAGDVFASGAGGGTTAGPNGAEQGGGGGGTGGMIGIDAPTISISTGRVVANGGGGGGGGGNSGGSPGGDGTTTAWNTRAASGNAATGAGDGGPGTALNQTTNINGVSSDGGAGGGGGGLGIVWIDGTLSGGTMISPAPTPH